MGILCLYYWGYGQQEMRCHDIMLYGQGPNSLVVRVPSLMFLLLLTCTYYIYIIIYSQILPVHICIYTLTCLYIHKFIYIYRSVMDPLFVYTLCLSQLSR